MRSLFLMIAALLVSGFAKAQTNAQVLYDFGSDRKFVTLTLGKIGRASCRERV